MGNASVDIMSVDAVGTHSDERSTVHKALDITIQFTTKPGKLRASNLSEEEHLARNIN